MANAKLCYPPWKVAHLFGRKLDTYVVQSGFAYVMIQKKLSPSVIEYEINLLPLIWSGMELLIDLSAYSAVLVNVGALCYSSPLL